MEFRRRGEGSFLLIQVIGLRDYIDQNGKKKKAPRFFEKKWRFANIEQVFDHAARTKIIEEIPETERYNMYFTVAECFEEAERKLQEQWAIPFDIDGIEIKDIENPVESAREVALVACQAIGVEFNETASLFSGNGVQLFIRTTTPIIAESYFDEVREHYGAICQRINKALALANLKGHSDSSVWSAARLMRLCDTENRKDGKPSRMARVIQSTMKPIGFNLVEASGLQVFQKAETVPVKVLAQYPAPDTAAVLSECEFLKFCAAEPAKVNEPAWYAMLSVTARLDDGRNLSHKMSEGHPGYVFDETDMKIDQALAASGPRTCKDIETRWDGCPTCKHYQKITCPIMIRGADYIATKDTGFRVMRQTEEGKLVPGRPDYRGLIRFFRKKNLFITVEKSEQVYIYNGKFWETISDTRLREWMTQQVQPEPSVSEMREFLGQLKTYHVQSMEWFYDQSHRKMNFQNFVLDLETMRTEPHKPEFGFLNILPFNYDAHATCPNWDGYVAGWMADDKELIQLLHEWGGYCVSGDPYWLHKVMMLSGVGENGKSIYMETIAKVVGKGNYSTIAVEQMGSLERRYSLIRSMYNYTEEASSDAFLKSEPLKVLSGGGEVEARALYENSIEFRNRSKILLSVNNPPYSQDKSHALYRRLMIVPFNVKFAEGDPRRVDRRIIETCINNELPGICNRFIEAYKGVKRNNGFIVPASSKSSLEVYIKESDSVLRFSDDELEFGDFSAYKDEVYQRYVMYCRDHGERERNSVWFWRQFYEKHPGHKETREAAGERRRVTHGIRLIRREL